MINNTSLALVAPSSIRSGHSTIAQREEQNYVCMGGIE